MPIAHRRTHLSLHDARLDSLVFSVCLGIHIHSLPLCTLQSTSACGSDLFVGLPVWCRPLHRLQVHPGPARNPFLADFRFRPLIGDQIQNPLALQTYIHKCRRKMAYAKLGHQSGIRHTPWLDRPTKRCPHSPCRLTSRMNKEHT
jgi:hypothetical protein